MAKLIATQVAMPRHTILFLGILLCSTATAAQVGAVSPEAISTRNIEAKKALPPSAEIALDAARRWTQAALEDGSNLSPVENDFLLVRAAKAWNAVDHAKAEEYLKDAMQHLETDVSQKPSPRNTNASEAISQISSDVMAVDRDAWNRLIELLPPSDVSDTIAAEAQTLAEREDPKGAMELERKSLAHGGSSSDLETLYSLVGIDQNSASQLFDEILKTASNPQSNPDLLSEMLHRLNGAGDDAFGRFLTQERRQRLADLVAQRTLADSPQGDEACNYSIAVTPLLSQYSPAMQSQFRAIVDDCNRKGAYGQIDADGRRLNNTDDLVQAMNDASDAKIKADLRWRAAMRAAHVDGDYERAIQLCLEASPQERAADEFPFDRFNSRASNLAWHALSTALRKHDDLEVQRVLAVLTPGLKAHAEINAIRFTSKDQVQSLLMHSDARNILEDEVPPQTITYFFMLGETTQLAPEDINVSWRVLGKGLNHFAQQMRTAQSPGGRSHRLDYVNPLYPWPLPQKAVVDEGLVRAVVGDLTSPEFRACLRLSVIQAFLTRYTDALQELQAKGANLFTPSKN